MTGDFNGNEELQQILCIYGLKELDIGHTHRNQLTEGQTSKLQQVYYKDLEVKFKIVIESWKLSDHAAVVIQVTDSNTKVKSQRTNLPNRKTAKTICEMINTGQG